MMKGIDAPHYDAQRTTWAPTSDIVNMFQDTLVALDWDGKTPIPYLAKSWTVSPDGKIYTFKLRDDVTLLQRQEVHRRRRGLLLQAAEGSRDQGAVRLARRQHQGAARARSLLRVEYELAGAVLRAAAAAHHVHHRHPQQGERRGAGQGLRRQGRSTAPARGASSRWQPRTEIVLKRHDAYKWGPSMYQNKGPVKFEKLVDQDRARGFEPRRRHDGRPVRHHPPDSRCSSSQQVKAAPDAQRARGASPTSSCSISASRRRGRWWPTSACARR